MIFLDLMMPVMDGFEFVLELRKESAYRSIPIVVVSAKDLTEMERKRLSGVVAQFVQKGPNRDDLLREIRNAAVEIIQRPPPSS